MSITPAEIPLLDDRRCTGCGECVTICPANCLEMSGPTPWLPRPGDCTSCGVCELLCPVQAIKMSAGP